MVLTSNHALFDSLFKLSYLKKKKKKGLRIYISRFKIRTLITSSLIVHN